MDTSSFRSVAVGSLVLGSCLTPLLACVALQCVALQYEGGALPLTVLAAAHFVIFLAAARLACPRPQLAVPRVDFVRAEA